MTQCVGLGAWLGFCGKVRGLGRWFEWSRARQERVLNKDLPPKLGAQGFGFGDIQNLDTTVIVTTSIVFSYNYLQLRRILIEETKESKSNDKNWNDMTYEVLIKNFMALDISDLATVSVVSRYWREVCSDPTAGFWNKIDLSRVSLNSMSIRKPNESYLWRDKYSMEKMSQFLNNALTLSKGKTSCLIFPPFRFMNDAYFFTVALRCCNLKQVVLPSWEYLSDEGPGIALRLWRDLESITITGNYGSPRVFLAAIGKHCTHYFREVTISCSMLNIVLTLEMFEDMTLLRGWRARLAVVEDEDLLL